MHDFRKWRVLEYIHIHERTQEVEIYVRQIKERGGEGDHYTCEKMHFSKVTGRGRGKWKGKKREKGGKNKGKGRSPSGCSARNGGGGTMVFKTRKGTHNDLRKLLRPIQVPHSFPNELPTLPI